MALKHKIAGYLSGGIWIDEVEEEIHPLEEEVIKKEWALGEIKKNIPVQLTKEEEIELLITGNVDEIKSSRERIKAEIVQAGAGIENAENEIILAKEKWENFLKINGKNS